MWLTIAFQLISFLGPILWKVFQDWLKNRLAEKAAELTEKVGAVPFLSTQEAQLQLLAAVRDDLWFWQFGKKAAIDQCVEVVRHGKADLAKFGMIGR